jgi:broad specificity phosphatase PhoE
VATRVLRAARAARAVVAGTGKDAVCVSHQLPIVSAQRHAEGLRLFHDPRKRRCNLASVTSLTFDGDLVVRVDYAEPAATLPSGHGAGA